MSRVPSLSSPFLLGFDEIERVLDRVVKGADGYPPYNIERCDRADGQPERLRITLAVAGFTRDQLDVTIEENDLPLPDINDVNQAGYGFNDSLYERLTITPTYHLSEIKDALGGPVRRALEFPAQPESNRLSSLAQEGRNYPHAGTSLTRKTSGREARG